MIICICVIFCKRTDDQRKINNNNNNYSKATTTKKKKKVSRCVHKQTLVDLNKILYISRVYNSKQYTQHHFSSIPSVPGISYKTNSAMTAVKTNQTKDYMIDSFECSRNSPAGTVRIAGIVNGSGSRD